MAADTQQLLSGILNVVSRTEKHIAEINKNIKEGKGNTPKDGLDAAARGSTGATDTGKNTDVSKKLDTIIDLLETSLGAKASGNSVLNSLGIGIHSVATGLKKFQGASKGSGLFISFLEKIEEPLKNFGNKEISDGVKNLQGISMAVVAFSTNMFKAGMILLPVVPMLPVVALTLKAMGWVFDGIGKQSQNILKGTRVAGTMGKSMMFLAGGIALFTLAAVASSMALKKFGFPTGAVGMIAGMALMFAVMGKIPAIQKGVRVLNQMGVGMLFLAGGIAILALTFAISAKVMSGAKLGGMLGAGAGIIVAIGGLAVMMVLLGTPPVAKGARTMKTMGFGMLVLAGGIAIMGLTFAILGKAFGVSPLEVGGGIALALLGLGFAMSMLGKMGKDVLQGSIAVAVMSLSFVVFAYGLKKTFEALNGRTWEDIGKMGTAVLGIALILTLIGNPYTVEFTLLGAVALGAMGTGLYALAKGIKSYTELGALEFPTDQFVKTMKGLRDGFLVLVGDDDKGGTGIMGALKSVGKAAVGGSKLSIAVLNSIGIGAALSSMAKGVGAWANLQNIPLIAGYDKDGMPIYTGEHANVTQAVDNVLTFIGDGKSKGILLPFIKLSEIAGLDKQGDFSIMKMVTGNDLSQSPFMRGVQASMKIGKVLSATAKGVAAWANLQNIPLISGYDSSGSPIYGSEKVNIDQALLNIDTFIGDGKSRGILVPFIRLSELGGMQKSGFSVMKLYTGNDLSQSPFMAGVSAALKIGKVLSSMAAGVGAWANLQNIPLLTGYDKDGKPTYEGFANVDTALSQITTFIGDGKKTGILVPFINISKFGGLEKSGFSVMKFYTGTDLSQSPFMKGVSAALQIGKVLSLMGQGVGTWANLQNIPLLKGYDKDGRPMYEGFANVDAALTQITSFIGDGEKKGILAVFKKFTDSKDKGFSVLKLITGNDLSLTPLQRGIANALQIGKVLTSLGEGIGTFANLQNIPLISGYDKEGRATYSGYANVEKAIENAGYAIQLIGDTFVKVAGEPEPRAGMLGWLGLTKNTKMTSLTRAVKAMAPVGDLLSGLAQGIKTFADLQNIKLIDHYEWNEKAQQNVAVYSTKSIDIKSAIHNAAYTIELLGESLVKVAGEPESTGGPLGWIGLTKNKKATSISRAASALAPIGDLLASLAQGINTFANLQNIKLIETYRWDEKAQQNVPVYSTKSINVEKAIENAAYTIELLGDALVKVAGEPAENSALFGWVKWNTYPKTSAIRKAANALQPIGEMLGGLAQGMKTFAEIQNIKIIETYRWDEKAQQNVPVYSKQSVNVKQIAKNIVNVIEVLSEGLAKLVPDPPDNLKSFEDWRNYYMSSPDAKLRRAIAAIGGIGEPLQGVAETIRVFADVNNIMTIKGYDKDGRPIYGDPVNVSQIATNVVEVIKTVTGGLATLMPDIPVGTKTEGLIQSMQNSPDANIRRAVGAVMGIGEMLNSIGSGLKIFSDLTTVPTIIRYDNNGNPVYGNPVDVTNVSENIKKVLLTTIEALDMVAEKTKGKKANDITVALSFTKFTDDLVKVANVATDFEKFANSFTVLSNSMGKFTTEFKKLSPTSIESFSLWTKSLTDFAKLNTSEFATKLELVKKSFGVGEEKTTAEQMDDSPAGTLNFMNKDQKEKDAMQAKKDQMMLTTLASLSSSIDAMSNKLDDLSVRVIGKVIISD